MRHAPSPSSCAEIASSKSLAVAGSIVNVGRSRRSRRAGASPPAASRASCAARSTPGGNAARRPRSSISASITSRATSGRPRIRAIRARPARRRGSAQAAPAARGRRRASARPSPAGRAGRTARRPGSARASRAARRAASSARRARRARRLTGAARAPSTASARSRASSRGGRGVVARPERRAPGPLPGATPRPPRLRPSGMKYWPAVMSSAPPLDSSMTCWKTPLPNVRVPDEHRALAVLQGAGDDLRRRGRVAVDEHDERRRRGDHGVAGRAQRALGHAAPARRHDRPVAQERAGDELRLADQAAAVAAQVEDAGPRRRAWTAGGAPA